MSSHIYLTKNQIHDMFTEDNILVSPKFTTPEVSRLSVQQKGYFFESSSPSKNGDKSTDNFSNRKISQDSMFDSKIEMKIVNSQFIDQQMNTSMIQQLTQQNSKLQQQVQSQQTLISNLQNQITIVKDLNKKYQTNIADLLQQIRKLEKESQFYQDQLLKNRLTLQDKIKLSQQIKIDLENAKIQLLQKDQTIETITQQLQNYVQVSFPIQQSTQITYRQEPSRIGRSPNRIDLGQSCQNVSYIRLNQRSHSTNLQNF